MWDKLFEELNKDFTKVIATRDFIKVDKNLRNFKSISVSMSLPQNEVAGIKIDDDRMLGTIFNEITQNIYKIILREVASNTSNTFVDLRNEQRDFNVSHVNLIEKLCTSIQVEDYKSRLSSDISDSAGFHFSNLQNRSTNGSFVYLTGKLGGKDVYVDPYMRYNDYKIFLFDEISLNVENFTAEIRHESTFITRLIVKYDYDFLVSPGKTINVIDLVNSDALLVLKAEHREQQIDKILNEKES
jgi:hypothetical protein